MVETNLQIESQSTSVNVRRDKHSTDTSLLSLPLYSQDRCSCMYIYMQRMAIFTLKDEQIIWTDKSSQTDKSSDVTSDDFLKTIYPSSRTSQPKSNLNSLSDGLRQTNGRFACCGGMELAKRVMVCGKFAWKLAELAVLNSH